MTFKCFSLFSTMQTHAQACIGWWKYTTHKQSIQVEICDIKKTAFIKKLFMGNFLPVFAICDK